MRPVENNAARNIRTGKMIKKTATNSRIMPGIVQRRTRCQSIARSIIC